jgi:hypothetical protein
MKPSFSFNDALSAPFVLLRRRPLYLFAWGLIMMALVAVIYSLMIPLFLDVAAAGDRTEAWDVYMMESIRLQAALNGFNVLMYLIMLLTWTAAGRATLAPSQGDRFLFLRFSMDEVRVAVVIVAGFLAWYVALLVLVLIGVGIGAALWSTGQAATIGVLIVYGVLVSIACVWGWLRISLIAPASLILKRFAFAEGWAIARGQMWKLFGLNLVVWLIYMLAAIATYGLAAAVLFGSFYAQGLTWPQTIESAVDLEPLVRPMILPALLTLIPFSLMFGWVMALYAAPGIVAARQLLDGVPSTAPIIEDAPSPDALQPE